jgi:hypothetical protein
MARGAGGRHRVDANHHALIAVARAMGWSAQSLSTVGGGCPDVLFGKHDRLVLVEFKLPGEDLNDRQRRWHAGWGGPVAVVRTSIELQDALRQDRLPFSGRA